MAYYYRVEVVKNNKLEINNFIHFNDIQDVGHDYHIEIKSGSLNTEDDFPKVSEFENHNVVFVLSYDESHNKLPYYSFLRTKDLEKAISVYKEYVERHDSVVFSIEYLNSST